MRTEKSEAGHEKTAITEVAEMGGFIRLNPDTVHQPAGYTHVIKAGNTIYLAGQVARDREGRLVGVGDPEKQAEQVFQNLDACLRAAGASLDDVVKVTIFVTSYAYKEAVLKVRDKYLGGRLPASTFVVCHSLALPEYLVEIEAIAVV